MPRYVSEIPAGDIFEMLGMARRWLRQLGHSEDELDAMSKKVMASKSYEDACAVIGEYFRIVEDAS